MDKDTKCILLNHDKPYLKLGPFKFEMKNQNPEIGLIHDFVSENEITQIKERARGKMKSTPYTVGKCDFKIQFFQILYVLFFSKNIDFFR